LDKDLRTRYAATYPFYKDLLGEDGDEASFLIDRSIENFLIFNERDFQHLKDRIIRDCEEKRKQGKTIMQEVTVIDHEKLAILK